MRIEGSARSPEHAHRELVTLDEALREYERIDGARFRIRLRQFRRGLHFADADARALGGGLDHERQTDLEQRALEIVGAREHRVGRRCQSGAHHDALGLELVHGQRRGEHARAGVGDAEPFQRALDKPVLAAGSVQGDPGALESRARELLHGPHTGIEGGRVDAAAQECLEHRVAAHQRDLALARVAAEEHGDLAELGARPCAAPGAYPREPAHATSPTMRTSVASSTRCTCATVRRTCSMSASMSAARAAP